MVFFNYATMQMAAKIVYYGPGLCGKTTNLHHIYQKTSPQSRGEMVSLETETDRTLFFDLLPIDVGVIGGFKTRLQLYTVPGQVFYNTTRKLVLKGVDGIVFVADSQRAMLDANIESLRNLRENLAEIGLDLGELPLVIQLNKRDLPNTAPVDVMLDALDPERRAEHVEAIASKGNGVFETLKEISKLTLRTLRRRMTGEEPVRPSPPARTAQFRVQGGSDDAVRTVAGNVPVPARGTPSPGAPAASTGRAFPAPAASTGTATEQRPEQTAPAAEPVEPERESTAAAASVDRHILSSAPVAAPPAPPAPESPTQAESDVGFNREEPAKKSHEPEVKTVKVRSSIDVMAELEALRKRATQTTPKSTKKDALADLSALRPRRDIHRTLHLQVPGDALSRARSLRVTLSLEDGEGEMIESRDERVEIGDASDIQSLSVNLKIDQN
jgi:signal recognition particle receptor subunit beta